METALVNSCLNLISDTLELSTYNNNHSWVSGGDSGDIKLLSQIWGIWALNSEFQEVPRHWVSVALFSTSSVVNSRLIIIILCQIASFSR